MNVFIIGSIATAGFGLNKCVPTSQTWAATPAAQLLCFIQIHSILFDTDSASSHLHSSRSFGISSLITLKKIPRHWTKETINTWQWLQKIQKTMSEQLVCCLLAGLDLWKRMLLKCSITMVFTCLLLF